MKNIKLMYLTFIFVLFGCTPQGEEAFKLTNSAQSGSLAPSYWVGGVNAFPLPLNISSEFSIDETSAIIDTAGQWSTSTGGQSQLFDTSGSTAEKNTFNLNNFQDDVMGIYKVTSWPSELPQTALAVTQIFGTRKNIGSSSESIQINHADILVNYQNFSFTHNSGYGYDLQTVILHEMGHFLGLYHEETSTSDSVMYPSISRYISNRIPKDKDILNLSNKYGLDGHGVTSANISRSLASSDSSDNGIQEAVVIHFEMYPDGTEKSYMVAIRDSDSIHEIMAQAKEAQNSKQRDPAHQEHNHNHKIIHRLENPEVQISVPGVKSKEREQLEKKGTY